LCGVCSRGKLEALPAGAPATPEVLVIAQDARWLRLRDGFVIDLGT
jgi:hypothetical protein